MTDEVMTFQYADPCTIQYNESFALATVISYDGSFQGIILLTRGEDDTSWGETRQAWWWAVLDTNSGLIGRCGSQREALKSGCDANPHPLLMLKSILAYMAAGVEARNNPDSENYNIFPPEVTEWCYQMDSELSSLYIELHTAEEEGKLSWPI